MSLFVDVERRFPGGPTIAARLDLALAGPQVVVVFGPSGAGKSTLLRCVAGLERPDRGEVRFGGETWSGDGRWVPIQARGVGLLFQDFALFPHLSVADNVGYGAPRAGRAARVDALLRRFGVEALAGRRPAALSGGEQQRVALARALAPGPRLLLLDEPLSALDLPTRARLRGELKALLAQAAVPALVVTHDLAEAQALADHVVVMIDGRVRQVGAPDDVFDRPADAAVARAVGVDNVLPASVLGVEAGRATLEVGALRLVAAGTPDVGGPAALAVRAEDVVLGPAGDGANALAGRVAGVAREGPLARVTLDCDGLALVAVVARRAAQALEPGAVVGASIDPAAARAVPMNDGGPP
ncbi:MAG: ABC transporter ATP-binding protein [Planctomycetes bacterium]|nr:ABC transporter ATP-binding protein [Planctomycetota bacterium]